MRSEGHEREDILSGYDSDQFAVWIVCYKELSELHQPEEVQHFREPILHAHRLRSLNHIGSEIQIFIFVQPCENFNFLVVSRVRQEVLV